MTERESLCEFPHRFWWYTRKAFGWYLPRDGFRAALAYWWAHRRYWLHG